MKTTLYRYFDSDGQLLYVGITKNQFDRFASHSKNSQWFSQIATATFEHLDTREQALVAETNAIGTELPKYNKAGPVIAQDGLQHLMSLIAGQLPDEWHKEMSQKIAQTMSEINEFSVANEITKVGFAYASSFEWENDGEDRIVKCEACLELTNSKWFEYIETESQSIIDEYQVA